MSVAERGWDPRYLAAWRGRVDMLAARATRAARDPQREEARLRAATERFAVVAEHGRDYADLLDLARRPLRLDLSAEIPQPRTKRHPPSQQPRPRSGSLRATAGARQRRIRETRRLPAPPYRGTRGLTASANGDGTFSVTDRHGRPLRNLALTAAGSLVEYVPKELDTGLGELTARSVLAFDDLIVRTAKELARR